MKQNQAKASTRTRATLVTICVAAVVVGVVYATPAFNRMMAAPAMPAPLVQGNSREEPVVLLLTSTGFEQEEIRLRPGATTLQIDNGSGREGLQFTVTRPGAEATITSSVRTGGRYVERVPFGPGEWSVTEVSHPDWTCRIIVEP